MPIQRTAFKSVRKDKKRRQRNIRVASELKTLDKRFRTFLNVKKVKEAGEVLGHLISKLNKAASKGIIHKNNASRKISRLQQSYHKHLPA